MPWPPPEWGMPGDGDADVQRLAEYGLVAPGALPVPPPPPPPPTQKIGPLPTFGVGELAGPGPGGPPAVPPLSAEEDAAIEVGEPPAAGMQPGLGVPAAALDSVTIPPPPMPDEGGLRGDVGAPGPRDYENPLNNPDDVAMARQLREADPIAFGQLEAKQEIARRNELLDRQLEQQRQGADSREQRHMEMQAARERTGERQAKLDADAKALEDAPLESKSWAQHIAGAISLVLGAFAAASPGGGGKNIGLEMMNAARDQALAERKLKLQGIQRRQGSIDSERKNETDDYHEDMAFILASNQAAIRQIEMESQKYDPRGTSAIALERLRREAIAQDAKQRQGAYKEMLDQEIKVGEFAL